MGTFTVATSDMGFENDVLKSAQPVLVDFWAEWCGPCKALGPKLEEVASEFQGQMKVLKVNVDENPDAPSRYNVRGIPTMILFKDGKEVGQLVGNQSKDSIATFIRQHL
jgi:thioredoxin 1